jgi:peptidoglycan hydrolase-like protein with peptidoglycan-binding domain
MTPRLTRATFVVFLLLTLGVAANAIFMQTGQNGAGESRIAQERARQAAEAERARRLAIGKATPPPMAQAVTPAGPAKDNVAAETKKPETPARPEKAGVKEPPVPARLSGLRSENFNIAVLKVDGANDPQNGDGAPETVRAIQRELLQRQYGPIAQDGVPNLATRAAILAFEKDHGFALTGEANEALLKRILMGASADRGEAANAGKVKTSQAEHVIRTVQQSLVALGYQPGKIDGRTGDETVRAIREFEMDQGAAPTGRVSADLVARLGRVAGAGKLTPAR